MTRWQFVQATLRDSWVLPDQKMRLPLVWQDRQMALRLSIGVLSSLAKVIIPPTPLPPPASAWASPGPWQFSQASPSVLFRGWSRKRRPIFVCENLWNCSAWQPLQVSAPTYPGGQLGRRRGREPRPSGQEPTTATQAGSRRQHRHSAGSHAEYRREPPAHGRPPRCGREVITASRPSSTLVERASPGNRAFAPFPHSEALPSPELPQDHSDEDHDPRTSSGCATIMNATKLYHVHPHQHPQAKENADGGEHDRRCIVLSSLGLLRRVSGAVAVEAGDLAGDELRPDFRRMPGGFQELLRFAVAAQAPDVWIRVPDLESDAGRSPPRSA